MIINATPDRAEMRRNAKARRAERRADAVLFKTSRPLDPDAIIQRDIRATIRFNIGLLLLVGVVAALALFIAH